jgi:hypothetical protein
MDAEDFTEPEVGVAVAVTAALMSPKVRHGLRKGLVYAVAGLISVGDAAKDAVHGVKANIAKHKPAPVHHESVLVPAHHEAVVVPATEV